MKRVMQNLSCSIKKITELKIKMTKMLRIKKLQISFEELLIIMKLRHQQPISLDQGNYPLV